MFDMVCFAILRTCSVFSLREVLVEMLLLLPGMICPSEPGFLVAGSSSTNLDLSHYEVLG